MSLGVGTKEYCEEIATKLGYEPVQIDGIPEGFSWREPDLQIGDVVHMGKLVAFIPLIARTVWAIDERDLLVSYLMQIKIRDGK